MCELLVRTEDRINKDFYLNCKLTKRGDVITIEEDNHPWGNCELNNATKIIIKLPNTKISDLSMLLISEIDIDPKNPSKTLQARAFNINLDNLSKVPIIDINLLNNNIIVKQPIIDPTVIGVVKNIIG